MSAGGSTSIKKTITTACAYPLPKKNGWNSPKTSFRSVKGPIASPRRKSSSKCDLRTLRRNVRRPTSSAQRLTGHDVDEHLTRIGRVEAVEEFRERGLTRVARADQMQSLRSGTVRTIPQPCCNPVTRKNVYEGAVSARTPCKKSPPGFRSVSKRCSIGKRALTRRAVKPRRSRRGYKAPARSADRCL